MRDSFLSRTFSRTFFFLIFSFSLLPSSFAADSTDNTLGIFNENFNLKVKSFYVYDDNVVNSPKQRELRPADLGSRNGDSKVNFAGTASYLYKLDNKVQVRFAYDLDMLIHSSLHAYDLITQFLTVSPTYKLSPLMNVSLQYSYIYNHLNLKPFSEIHFISPSFNHMDNDFGLTRLAYTFKATNNLQYASRDNNQHSVGIMHYYFFNNYKSHLKGSYSYTTDNTRGEAFRRHVQSMKVTLKAPLFYDIVLDADIDLSFRNYKYRTANSGDRLRKDFRKQYSVNLSKELMKNVGCLQKLTAIGKYQRTENVTNLDINEYSSNVFQIGLQGEF